MNTLKSPPIVVVLDASAVLALLFNETGSELVARHLQQNHCIVGAGNYAEIISRLLDRGLAPSEVQAALSELNIHWQDNSKTDGETAGFLRPSTRAAGLSLGDRLCLALAQRLEATVVTSDRAWLDLANALHLTIISIRPKSIIH